MTPKKPTKSVKDRQRQKSAVKELRDMMITKAALAGKTQTQIAEEFDLHRDTVRKALSADDKKQLLELGSERIALMMTDALDTMQYMMNNKGEFGVTGAALQSAKAILKTLGLLKETLDLNHQFPKPLVIDYGDGTKTVIGSEQDLKDEEE